MAYSGSTKLLSGLRVQGAGDFPLVNAPDVYVDDDTRLDAKLSSLDNSVAVMVSVNDIASISEVQEIIDRYAG